MLDFKVIRRRHDVCLLVGQHRLSGDIVYYEVHLLRMKSSRPESLDAGSMILCAPSESEWGKYGWTYLRLEEAELKFAELVKQRSQKRVC